ncbi:hypothetical protein [Vibrio sp. A2-1]|uniref:hypothetical protein n=1 Tax=Vibrio sp. A2-1 TaxID=2912252 RepID=UPI001F1C04FC|nr:hypothetical protein [Vibrio sp. A2-1]MCF7485436.1 hypothetical protein [Vibrio sp. A2-1]
MVKLIVTVILVILLWLLSPALISNVVFPLLDIKSDESSGLYTAIAALFSALAFSALLVTLWLQREQLNIQKKELESAKSESDRNIEIAAYTALLAYYGNGNKYNPIACDLTPMDIAKRLDKLLGSPNRLDNEKNT